MTSLALLCNFQLSKILQLMCRKSEAEALASHYKLNLFPYCYKQNT